jgi:hypothetical protein
MTALDIAGNASTGAALAIAGAAALLLATARGDARSLPAPLAAVFGLGLLFLASDETFDLHERAGAWLYNRGVEAPGPINHLDDVIVLAYVALAALASPWVVRALLRTPRLLQWLLAAGTLLVAAALLDALGDPGSWIDAPEEALEALGASALAYAFAREAALVRTLVPAASTPRELATAAPVLPQSPGS